MVNINIGNTILYASIPIGLSALLLFLAEQFGSFDFNRYTKWLVRIFAVLLSADYILLSYYFAVSDFTINYVWAYSSRGLPIYYKLAAVLAGQQGTLVFWAALIALGSVWLNERRTASRDFIKKTQIVVLFLGLYFVFLTLLNSPFNTIYELYPNDIPLGFIPEDGNGLNPLLIDPWMAAHPILMFLGYAATTNPFAVSIVYLFQSIRKKSSEELRKLLPHVVLWCRVAWFFLTLGIAFGGIWAYKVLGWGGFWAWDPVETASLIPWLMLTGAMHALVEHKKDKHKYVILAPVMVTMTFSLVVYATLVTRSGFFESVHAFAAGSVGFYLVALAAIAFGVPLILAIARYVTSEETPAKKEKSPFISKTNIFYVTILIFVVLTFISVWGITFPALVKLFTGTKYAINVAFFNIWSYPFFIFLLLLGGLCFTYNTSTKQKNLKEFALFTALTLLAAIYKPNDAWNIVDYTSIVSPQKPLLYTLIGSVSALSIVPPVVYLTYGVVHRFKERFATLKTKQYKITEIGIITIHLSIILIFVGAVVSTMFTSEFSVSLSKADKDKIVYVEGTPYSVKLIDYGITKEYEKGVKEEKPQGMSISEFQAALISDLNAGIVDKTYTVHGIIGEVINVNKYTYLRLTEGQKELWIATSRLNVDIPIGTNIIASGFLMADFPSLSLNKTFDIIMFSDSLQEYQERQPFYTAQYVKIAIYKGNVKVGEGTARTIQYKNGDAKKVMIDRSLSKDVYVIFTGFSGNSIPLDVKFKPLVNNIWIGVILFSVSITAMIIFDPRYAGKA